MIAIKCDNKFDRGKEVYVSTPEQLAEWMNKLAMAVGIGLSPETGSGLVHEEKDGVITAVDYVRGKAVAVMQL